MLGIDLCYKNTEPVGKYIARTHATCREKSMTSLRKKLRTFENDMLYATCLTFVIVALQAAGKIFPRRNITFKQIRNFNTVK